ncbi:MAG: DUF2680 domain-containing protein [Desulfotomaculaceae bacterium]|nr:DUF2680 domain-containing protein [Desulfotomaculaceae bacterium]
MKTSKWRVGGLLLAVALLVGALTGTAFATSGTQSDSSMATLYQDFVAKLAANLGMDQEQVTAALDTTKKQMLDEAVQQGKMTQEQADKIAARKDGGFCGFGFHEGKLGGRNLDGMANILGITSDQLKTELKSGKKLQDIVTEHDLTMEQFSQRMQEQRKEEISKGVADGKITQEQADKMLQNMEQRLNCPNFDKAR